MWRRRDESGSNERKERAWRRSRETIGIKAIGVQMSGIGKRHAAKRGEERRREASGSPRLLVLAIRRARGVRPASKGKSTEESPPY